MQHAIIIDDNPRNINVLGRLLEQQNFESVRITQPSKIEEALHTITQTDIIFLDLEMPMIDGFQVLDWLKSDVRFASVPVIAYTVHVSELKAAYDYGFDGFLGKPINSDRFPDQLKRILSGQPVWEAM